VRSVDRRQQSLEEMLLTRGSESDTAYGRSEEGEGEGDEVSMSRDEGGSVDTST
jgi:hypothetical protein